MRLTIRARLTLLYGGLFFVAGAVVLGVTYFLVQHELGARPTAGISTLQSEIPGKGVSGTVAAGNVVMVDGKPVTIQEADVVIKTDQQRFRSDALNSLLTQGGIALGGVGLLAVAFGWLLAGRALRPVHAITDTARRIGGADGAGKGLHERIAMDGPKDEIRELADTFDAMLERLDSSFDGQRRFVANASHELRTPLALNRALIEVAMTRDGAPEQTVALAETLLSVNARHERLIDGLLTLAESENSVTDRAPVDLAEIAEHVVTELDAGVIKLGAPDAVPSVDGDAVLLERMIQNLVENALRYNSPDDPWVTVEVGSDGASVLLTVENPGSVIPEYEAETLFRPFRRLEFERAGGAGLGLSIVRAVARAHGGDATATPRPGGGLVVTVRLPARTVAG